PPRIPGLMRRYLDRAGPVAAVANHMGSLATQDMTVMSAVYRELHRQRVPFLQVSPAAGAVCKPLAASLGVAYAEPDAAIDGEARTARPALLDKRWKEVLAETRARSTHAALAVMARGVPVAMLLKLDDRGLTDEGPFDLACVVQPNGSARPAGHRLLEAFGVEPWPTWRYRLGSSVIEKTLMLVWGHDAVVVSYRHLEGPPVRLTASPVVVSRPLFELPVTIEPPCANADAKPGRAAGRNSARHAEGNTPRGR